MPLCRFGIAVIQAASALLSFVLLRFGILVPRPPIMHARLYRSRAHAVPRPSLLRRAHALPTARSVTCPLGACRCGRCVWADGSSSCGATLFATSWRAFVRHTPSHGVTPLMLRDGSRGRTVAGACEPAARSSAGGGNDDCSRGDDPSRGGSGRGRGVCRVGLARRPS
jgi:hypothetical protein